MIRASSGTGKHPERGIRACGGLASGPIAWQMLASRANCAERNPGGAPPQITTLRMQADANPTAPLRGCDIVATSYRSEERNVRDATAPRGIHANPHRR